MILICGAFLLFKSLANLQQVDIGARIDRVITMSIDLPHARYPSGHHLAAFYPMLVERLQAIPGVESAAISGDVPLEGTGGENLRMPGRDDRLLVRFKRADSGYFSTLGIPILSGRGFTPAIGRCAVRRRDQRGAGARGCRTVSASRPVGAVRRPARARFRPRSTSRHDHRGRHRQRARAKATCARRPTRSPTCRSRRRRGCRSSWPSARVAKRWRRSPRFASRARARCAAGPRRHPHHGTDLGAEPVGVDGAGLAHRDLRNGFGPARRSWPLRGSVA